MAKRKDGLPQREVVKQALERLGRDLEAAAAADRVATEAFQWAKGQPRDKAYMAHRERAREKQRKTGDALARLSGAHAVLTNIDELLAELGSMPRGADALEPAALRELWIDHEVGIASLNVARTRFDRTNSQTTTPRYLRRRAQAVVETIERTAADAEAAYQRALEQRCAEAERAIVEGEIRAFLERAEQQHPKMLRKVLA